MSFTLVNFFNTALSAASSSTATTFTVSSSTNLPTLASGEILPITLNDAATRQVFEICYVTSISGNVLTVERAQEGTSAQNWNVGDFIWNGPTAGTALLQNTVDPFTSSGLITANGGIVVPSGQTITIPNATANNEPVALGQLSAPTYSTNYVNSPADSTAYSTSLSFTPPSNGTVMMFGFLTTSGNTGLFTSIQLLVNGTQTGTSDSGASYPTTEVATYSVSSGIAYTLAFEATTPSSGAASFNMKLAVIFIPN